MTVHTFLLNKDFPCISSSVLALLLHETHVQTDGCALSFGNCLNAVVLIL